MTEFVEHLSFPQLVLFCGSFFGAVTIVSIAVGFAMERAFGPTRQIFAVPLAEGQLRWELLSNIKFVFIAAVAFAWLLDTVATLPAADETFAEIALTFFVCWFGFEVYYWFLHRAMHSRYLYRFHRLHHNSRVTSPLTGYSMSTVEILGWLAGLIGVPLIMSFVTPISLIGFLVYHAVYQIPGNVVGHANIDPFPAASHKSMNSWVAHPTTFHALHHARISNNYCFGGGTFMDRLLGTEWEDWPEVHARVISGNPLRKLSERIPIDSTS